MLLPLGRPRDKHRDLPSIITISFAVECRQIPFLEPNGNEHVGCRGNGKEQVSCSHVGSKPEGHMPAQQYGMADELVESPYFKSGIGILPAQSVKDNLACAEQVEVIHDKAGEDNETKAQEKQTPKHISS